MVFAPLDPLRFVGHVGEWLDLPGPDSDVVVSCRVRLARNVAGFPFVLRLKPDSAEEVCGRLRSFFSDRELDGDTHWIGMKDATPVMRLLLRERHLVSRDLAPTDPRLTGLPGRAVAFNMGETVSVMINEEDHLRLQALSAGNSLRAAWKKVRAVDEALASEIELAFSEEFGFLTGCPTNVGTGLRASVMMHLPALGIARKELGKVFVAAQRTGLAVRGMYGEGSRAAGDFYQVSNQVTLGRSEEQLIAELEHLVPCIVDYERRVRSLLFDERKDTMEERITHSRKLLRSARSLRTDVALMHLSNLRLGISLGLVSGISSGEVDRMAIQIQKGHVHTLSGGEVDQHLAEPTERDRMRASFLRRRMGELGS